ncbi:MAG: serine/threonine-protein kinase [Phycisphaerae bacterium]|jgi:serine/threonine-protein kinase
MTKYQAGMRISEYVLENCIGSGTFGEVWQARHHVWDSEHVAVKLPTEPEYVRYLQREGVVVHGLRHANIIRVIGFDPFAENPYLVMELVRGPSLRQVIDEHPTGLSIDVTLCVLRGLLRAMEAAHAGGVLHRDLKPGNVLLDLNERPIEELTVDDVKIGDFGLGVKNAESLRSIAQSASLAREDQLVGTLAYMASEVRDGDLKPDARSDLYSVGVVLFEMLTGERPAGAELPSTVRAQTPPGLDEVFRRLYARHDRRYENARAVLDDLDARLTVKRPSVVMVPPPPPPRLGVVGKPDYCPRCQHVVGPDDQFCTQCRYQLVPHVRRCPSCDGYPGLHDRFCIFCGAALPDEEE